MSNEAPAATAETAAAQKPPQNLTVSEVFGQATWLMTQSRGHRTMFISDLEWMLMPPILLRQFRLFPGKDQPLGIALWAQLSDEASQRLEAGGKLKPDDWKSGDNYWLVELLAPFGQQDAMLGDIKSSIFKGKTFKMHAADTTGARKVVTLGGEGIASSTASPTQASRTAKPEATAPTESTINKALN